MTHDCHALRVHVLVLFQIVECAAQSISPGTNGPPLTRQGRCLSGFEKQRSNAISISAFEIRFYVCVVDGGKCIASGNDSFCVSLRASSRIFGRLLLFPRSTP